MKEAVRFERKKSHAQELQKAVTVVSPSSETVGEFYARLCQTGATEHSEQAAEISSR